MSFFAVMTWPPSDSQGHAFDFPQELAMGSPCAFSYYEHSLHDPGSLGHMAQTSRLLVPSLALRQSLFKLWATLRAGSCGVAQSVAVLPPGPNLIGSVLPSLWVYLLLRRGYPSMLFTPLEASPESSDPEPSLSLFPTL